MLDLPYPGGPLIDKYAQLGNTHAFQFSKPRIEGLNFSFSGLKTFALNTFQNCDKTDQDKADIALAFQNAVADTLAIKCRRALQQTHLKTLVVAGGVSANTKIRAILTEMVTKEGGKIFFPRPEFCTDNGAMIAYAGYRRFLMGQIQNLEISARPRWLMAEW